MYVNALGTLRGSGAREGVGNSPREWCTCDLSRGFRERKSYRKNVKMKARRYARGLPRERV